MLRLPMHSQRKETPKAGWTGPEHSIRGPVPMELEGGVTLDRVRGPSWGGALPLTAHRPNPANAWS